MVPLILQRIYIPLNMTDFDVIFGVGTASTPLFQADSAFRREYGQFAATALSGRPAAKTGVPLPRRAAAADPSVKPSKKRKALSDAQHQDTGVVTGQAKRVRKDAEPHAEATRNGRKSKMTVRQVHKAPVSHMTSAAAAGKLRAGPAEQDRQPHAEPVPPGLRLDDSHVQPSAVEDGDGTLVADGSGQAAAQPEQPARKVFTEWRLSGIMYSDDLHRLCGMAVRTIPCIIGTLLVDDHIETFGLSCATLAH